MESLSQSAGRIRREKETNMTTDHLYTAALDIAAELGYRGTALTSFAKRLRGDTPEALRQDAEELSTVLRVKTTNEPTPEPTADEAFTDWAYGGSRTAPEARLFSD